MKETVIRLLAKPLCVVLIVCFVMVDVGLRPAQAQMISTETVAALESSGEARERVAAFLAREDVETAMISHGVAPEEVRNRIAALSDVEIQKIAGQIDQLPAGASFGTVVGAVLFVFIVLLVTDILGFTKVFPFTRAVR